MRNGTPHACSLATVGSSESNPPPMSGMTTKRAPRSASACATSMLEPLTLSTSSAPASTAVVISPGSSESTLTRMPAPTSSRTTSASAGNGESRRAADVDDVGARFAVARGLAANGLARQTRCVVDLGDDLDIPGAVLARVGRPSEVTRDVAQVLGPLLHVAHRASRSGPRVAFAQARGSSPGRYLTSASSDRAIHDVVISAATVILRTATS